VDYATTLLYIGIATVLVSALYGAPSFINGVLDLRKRWRTEFPPKTALQILREIPKEGLNENRIIRTIRLAMIRGFVIGPIDIGLVGWIWGSNLTGNPLPLSWLVLIDLWLAAMFGFGVYVVRRMRPLTKIIRAAREVERGNIR
jgi:hypothetical protein